MDACGRVGVRACVRACGRAGVRAGGCLWRKSQSEWCGSTTITSL